MTRRPPRTSCAHHANLRALILAGAGALAACHGPPTGPAPAVDASSIPDGPANDAALPDATSTDAAPGTNPRGLRLVDVSTLPTGALIAGGAPTVDRWGVGTGAAIGDLDGDGDLDVVLARSDDPSSPRRAGPTLLLRSRGPGSGEELPAYDAEPTVSEALAGARARGVALGDIDRDGDLDLFVAADDRDVLLENDGDAHFVDVTDAAGVAGPPEHMCAGALFADVNRDGLLDLYVYCHTLASPPLPDDRARNRLFLNVGDGRFEDVSAAAGVDDAGAAHAAAAFDLDGTGELALYVANDTFCYDGVPQLPDPERYPGDVWYRPTSIDDQGVPRFIDHAEALGLGACRASMGAGVGDVDGDLDADLYVTDIGANELYLTEPGAPPLEASAAYGVELRRDAHDHPFVSWGARLDDLDADGALELVVANGATQPPDRCEDFHQLDHVLRQPALGAPFVDVTESVGWPSVPDGCDPAPAGAPLTGRGIAAGDLDGDGDTDLVLGAWVEPFRFFRTDVAAPGAALRVRAIGTVSSPDPIGARLEITLAGGARRAAFRVAGGDPNSQSDARLVVGLGDAPTLERAMLRWPSGYDQDLPVAPGLLTVVEPPWLSVEPRVVDTASADAVLTYRPHDPAGSPLGLAGNGRLVTATRSDGLPVVVTAHGDGRYTAPLPHPGVARRTVISISVDGVVQRPRPMVIYR